MNEPTETTHVLKTDPEVFDAVERGEKTFEIRFNDRNFKVGDALHLRRTKHTGDEMKQGAPLIYGPSLIVFVTHVLRGPIYGLADGWVILSFEPHHVATLRADLARAREENHELLNRTVYPPNYTAIARLTAERDAALKERDEARRCAFAVIDALKWNGDGYEWNPQRGDYREDPKAAVYRHAEHIGRALAALRERNEALENSVRELIQYGAHFIGCSVREEGVCICGLDPVCDRGRTLLSHPSSATEGGEL